jgi:hypothetical protein
MYIRILVDNSGEKAVLVMRSSCGMGEIKRKSIVLQFLKNILHENQVLNHLNQ